MNSLSAEAQYVLQFINQTRRSIFLTGKAGTGKTTLLREIMQTTHKKAVVVAPTGIAALNAAGVTIHSLFQLPFGAFLPTDDAPTLSGFVNCETKATLSRHFRMNATKRAVLQSMDLLVIDEVSMLYFWAWSNKTSLPKFQNCGAIGFVIFDVALPHVPGCIDPNHIFPANNALHNPIQQLYGSEFQSSP